MIPDTSTRTRIPGWRWLLVAAYMAGIFVLSAQSSLPELPGHPSDKLEHFIAYGLLGALVAWALVEGRLARIRFRTVLWAVFICSAYGYSDEVHQRFVPNRTYDLWDWAADTGGATLAAAMLWAFGILFGGRSRVNGL